MDSPEEIIENWKKTIKKEKEVNMLKCILQDLKLELSDVENWQSDYESLIEEVEDKLNPQNNKKKK